MARGRVLKHDGTTTVTVVADDRRQWVIKRYNTKNRWHAVRRQVRAGRALNCWNAASWLEQARINTPRPVAVVEERRFRVLRGRSYFICEYIEGETLDRMLQQGGEKKPGLIDQATGIVHRLQNQGIVHGDMKATNFIVSDGRIFLVDLDAARRGPGRRIDTGLQKDLHRFLRNWSEHPAVSHEFEKRLEQTPGNDAQV